MESISDNPVDNEHMREVFEAEWERLDGEERQWKLPNHTLIELEKRYSALSAASRPPVDSLIVEWVLSDHNGKQFDAEGLIRHFHIVAGLPALRAAYESLAGATDAPRRDRRTMLQGLIESLESLA